MKKTAYLAFALLGVIRGSNFIFMKWAVNDINDFSEFHCVSPWDNLLPRLRR
jgi:hypothetical protein